MFKKKELGMLGFIGFFVTIIAIAWTIGTVEVSLFSFPVINELNPSVNIMNVAENEFPSPIKEAFVTSSILLVVGLLCSYGIAIFRSSKHTRMPGLLFLQSGAASAYSDPASIIGYICLPIAVCWMCIRVIMVINAKKVTDASE
ncbi:hypothetical protein [Paenibacillus sp. OV219]|uniref:hypothetical protein n=1 Tax=Paenibacillus sp. OV219 TaxID=1884377 RepID=UPI000B84EF7A|nr:hypothetical protein [Paenibacillus sp. OV219]